MDDSSPLLTYTGSWLDTPSNDTLAANYSSQSLHTTFVPGAEVTLKFNGTGVWFYGGHRPGYGSYVLSVDGSTVGSGTSASSAAAFNQLLEGTSDLTMGEHTAVLLSGGGGPMDVDYVIFETGLGSNGYVILLRSLRTVPHHKRL